jgi:hypothetical protein
MRKVFLCHAKEDEIVVRKCYSELQLVGFEPWIDKESLLPGQDWKTVIETEINKTNYILVFISHNSVQKDGFVQREIRFALERAAYKPDGTIFIIPVRLEPIGVPRQLSHLHWVDLFEKEGMSRLLKALDAWHPSGPSLTWARDYLDERIAEVICCVYPTVIGVVNRLTTLAEIGDDGFGLDKATLGVRLEHTFGIVIPPDEDINWSTVSDVIKSVRRQLGYNLEL